MRYLRRVVQALFIIAVIWLTYTNSRATVDLVIFNKEVHNASAILVVAISLFTGGLIASFFAVMRELKSARVYRETEKENQQLKKELEETGKDLRLLKIDFEELRIENASLKKMIEISRKNDSTGVIL